MKNRESIQLVLNLYKRDNISLEEAMQLIDNLLENNKVITNPITNPSDTFRINPSDIFRVYCNGTGKCNDITYGTANLS